MKSYEDIVKELDSNIPANAVSSRQGGNGTSLDYLTAAYVINRLNAVLGQGAWSYNSVLTKLWEGEINGKFTVSYAASVTLAVKIGNLSTQFTDVGFGDGSDRNPSKPYELAMKEAVSDGIKRCAKNLGMAQGLGLYFKGGEYIDDAPSPQPAKAASAPSSAKQAPVAQPAKPAATATAPAKTQGKDSLMKTIKGYIAIAVDQKKATLEEFKGELKGRYNVDALAELNEPQLGEYLTFVNQRVSA